MLLTSRRVGMADEVDSKSIVGNYVWVQVPSPAENSKHLFRVFLCVGTHKEIGCLRNIYPPWRVGKKFSLL